LDATTVPSSARTLHAQVPREDLAWDLAAELPGLRQVTPFAPSDHGTGDLEGCVLVNEAASASGSPGQVEPFGVGAVLVLEHRVPGASTASVMLLAMRKREPGYNPAGGDWEYGVADSGGTFSQRGPLFACGRCHAEATRSHVFSAARWLR
jgi:hypothetical protein